MTINEKALELSPALVGQLRERAKQSLENFGASAETAELFKALVRIDPGDGLAWFNLGDSFRSACRFREAEEALLTARQLSPKSHLFVVDARLGMVLSESGAAEARDYVLRLGDDAESGN